MSEATLELERLDAVELYNVIGLMTGSASYKLVRSRVQEKVLDVWSEIKEKDIETEKGEKRKVKVDSREQRALAEGILGLLNKKGAKGEFLTTGNEFNFLQGIAKKCKLWKWLKSKIEVEEIPEMDEPLDDDPEFTE